MRVFVIVDVVHQRHELRDRVVEFDVLELLLLHTLDFGAQRQHPLHVLVVVRGVEVRLRHEVLDEIVRLGHELLHHGPTRIHARLAPLHRLPLLRIRHHVARLVPRQRLHPKAPLVPRLHDPLRLPPQSPHRPPHGALVHQHTAGALEEPAHVLDVGVGPVGEVHAEALLVVRGDFGRAAGAGALLGGEPDFAAIVVELLHRARLLVRDGVRGHDGFDVVTGGEVGFDAGAEGGGEGAGHGCCWWWGRSRGGMEVNWMKVLG